jgi:hypothetical protein
MNFSVSMLNLTKAANKFDEKRERENARERAKRPNTPTQTQCVKYE